MSGHSNSLSIAEMSLDSITKDPVPPCGNCRRVIVDEETRTGRIIKVILSGKNNIYTGEYRKSSFFTIQQKEAENQ